MPPKSDRRTASNAAVHAEVAHLHQAVADLERIVYSMELNQEALHQQLSERDATIDSLRAQARAVKKGTETTTSFNVRRLESAVTCLQREVQELYDARDRDREVHANQLMSLSKQLNGERIRTLELQQREAGLNTRLHKLTEQQVRKESNLPCANNTSLMCHELLERSLLELEVLLYSWRRRTVSAPTSVLEDELEAFITTTSARVDACSASVVARQEAVCEPRGCQQQPATRDVAVQVKADEREDHRQEVEAGVFAEAMHHLEMELEAERAEKRLLQFRAQQLSISDNPVLAPLPASPFTTASRNRRSDDRLDTSVDRLYAANGRLQSLEALAMSSPDNVTKVLHYEELRSQHDALESELRITQKHLRSVHPQLADDP